MNYSELRSYLEALLTEQEKMLDKLILLGEKDFYSLDASQAKTELIKIISELKKYNYQREIKQLEKQIALAEKDSNPEELSRLMTTLKNLTEEIKNNNLG